MSHCSECERELSYHHIVFVDELCRTYKILCDKCYQKFHIEWFKTHTCPLIVYDPHKGYIEITQ